MSELLERDGMRGHLHRPEGDVSAGLVLTHGAGSDCDTKLLRAVAEGFVERGVVVLRFDLPFRLRRASGPPHPSKAAEDREGIAAAVSVMRELVPVPVWAGGHSYGGRQASMLASERPGLVDALLLLSYPLHPPAKPEKLDLFLQILTTTDASVNSVPQGSARIDGNEVILALDGRTIRFTIDRIGGSITADGKTTDLGGQLER